MCIECDMKRKNDTLELILLGVGILLLLLLFVVKRRLDAPEETATAESSPAATSLLSESRNSGYPKASKKQLESVQQPFSSARFF